MKHTHRIPALLTVAVVAVIGCGHFLRSLDRWRRTVHESIARDVALGCTNR